MNEHDSEHIAALLVADGLEPTDDVEEADVVVLNTCCIRENADNRLYGHLGALRALRERRPGMQIAVGGCLAQKDRELIRQRADHVDVVFGTHNLTRAPVLLRQAERQGPVVEVLDAPVHDVEPPAALAAIRSSSFSAWMTIQTGCDNSCAFCIVPQVRGPEVSRPFDELVTEARDLASRGVREITLLGQNVNSYGRDITGRRPLFADLLRAVGAVEGIDRVRFTSPHPKDLRPETIAAMAETEAVCEHLHLPLQAGSDRVLAAMRRGYNAERYIARLEAAREAIDDLAVTTDIIVGFPGETEDDFERTLEVVAQAEYDSAYTFIFSPRPGTRAAAMTDSFVADEVVADRFERLRVVVERSALARHGARVGRTEEVLVEGPSKRDPSMWTGRTRQNKLVHFPIERVDAVDPGGPVVPAGPVGPVVPAGRVGVGVGLGVGAMATVEVTSAAPHHLRGELLSIASR
jgi:tRNA-2-methylthio-N6-dimethylallyladenosine synthase